MKKALVLFACLAAFATAVFAEALDNNDFRAVEKFENEKVTAKKVVPENQHVSDKNAKVWYIYNPAYNEVRFFYDTLMVTYDKGEAMIALEAVRQDFMVEQDYKKFDILHDNERHYKGDRGNRSEFTIQVKFYY